MVHIGNSSSSPCNVVDMYIGDSDNKPRRIIKAWIGDSENKPRLFGVHQVDLNQYIRLLILMLMFMMLELYLLIMVIVILLQKIMQEMQYVLLHVMLKEVHGVVIGLAQLVLHYQQMQHY